MTDRIKLAVLGLIAALIFVGGMGLAWKIWVPKPAKAETYAAAVKQTDGSVVLERKPDATARPAQELPKGAKLERVVQVTVKPSASVAAIAPTNGSGQSAASTSDLPSGTTSPCPPIRVDLSLVRMPDESRRVIASSPDGEIVGGVDIPVESAVEPKVLRWSGLALAGYDAFRHQRVYGGSISYSRGPVIATAGVLGQTAFVGGGIRW